MLQEHYRDLTGKPFFNGLVKYMNSGPVVAMVWVGLNAVKAGRVLIGETNPQQSTPGSIRGDFCVLTSRNVCHGSDSVESAEREIALWFNQNEVVNWKSCEKSWLYEF